MVSLSYIKMEKTPQVLFSGHMTPVQNQTYENPQAQHNFLMDVLQICDSAQVSLCAKYRVFNILRLIISQKPSIILSRRKQFYTSICLQMILKEMNQDCQQARSYNATINQGERQAIQIEISQIVNSFDFLVTTPFQIVQRLLKLNEIDQMLAHRLNVLLNFSLAIKNLANYNYIDLFTATFLYISEKLESNLQNTSKFQVNETILYIKSLISSAYEQALSQNFEEQ